MTRRLPPRTPDEPRECIPHTPFQMALFAVAGTVIFYAVMMLLPNPTSF